MPRFVAHNKYNYRLSDEAIEPTNTSNTIKQLQPHQFHRIQYIGFLTISDVNWVLQNPTDNGKLFQFRVEESILDMQVLNLARATHPQFVAGCKYHGTVGQSRPLHIYEMDNLPGTPYIIARDISATQPPDAVIRQRSTMKDLARYAYVPAVCFASIDPDGVTGSSHGRGMRVSTCLRMIQVLYSPSFMISSTFLPDSCRLDSRRAWTKFAKSSQPSSQGRFLLFSTTENLCEMNFLINSITGDITGIVDWAEARVLPFGFSLWALENIFGCMDSEGWRYYDNRRELEDLFWQTFSEGATGSSASDLDWQLIRVVRMAGLFYRYDLIMDGKNVKGVVGHANASSLAYLDAFCSADHWAPITEF